MDGINAQEQRDAEPALLRNPLQARRLLDGKHVQEGADLPRAYLLRHIGMAEVLILGVHVPVCRSLSGRHIAGADILAHLTDLLFEGHLLQQGLGALSGCQGGIFPIFGCACRQQEEGGQGKGEGTFHGTSVILNKDTSSVKQLQLSGIIAIFV